MFEKYLQLLLKWNKTYNLTAITDPAEIKIKHFEDSLAPIPFLPCHAEASAKAGRLLDIGTGAGFPGIPLKIARPDLHIVLLDAQRKKIAFCQAVIRELGLTEIEAYQGRAEDLKRVEKWGKFDVVISRATFSLQDFLKMALPFSKPSGLAIAMKSRNWEKERADVSGWKLQSVYDYDLSQNMGARTLLIFTRTALMD